MEGAAAEGGKDAQGVGGLEAAAVAGKEALMGGMAGGSGSASAHSQKVSRQERSSGESGMQAEESSEKPLGSAKHRRRPFTQELQGRQKQGATYGCAAQGKLKVAEAWEGFGPIAARGCKPRLLEAS